MPPVYLVVRLSPVAGINETVRYLHSTPETDADAECLAAELNRCLDTARYEVVVD